MKKYLLLFFITLLGFQSHHCKAVDNADDSNFYFSLNEELAQAGAISVQESVNALADQGSKITELIVAQAQRAFINAIKNEIKFNICLTCPTHLVYLIKFINYNGDIFRKLVSVARDVISDAITPLQDENTILKNNFDSINSGFATVEKCINTHLNHIKITLPLSVPLWPLDESHIIPKSGHEVVTRFLHECDEIVSIIEGYNLPHFKPLVEPLKKIVEMIRAFPLPENIIKKTAMSIEKYFTPKQLGSIIDFFNSDAYRILKSKCYILLDLRCFKGVSKPSFQTQIVTLSAQMLESFMELIVKIALG